MLEGGIAEDLRTAAPDQDLAAMKLRHSVGRTDGDHAEAQSRAQRKRRLLDKIATVELTDVNETAASIS